MKFIKEDLAEQVAAAVAGRKQIVIRGGGTKSFYGNAIAETEQLVELDVTPYTGISSYEPSELVMTARCGTLLSDIEAALDQENQRLAWEPPHFGQQATIGGAIATGLAGPGRMAAGGASDFVLGTVLLNAEGQELHFGGTVMKNVAGYDMSRLLTGSMGVFGPILEVSFKVLPKPICEVTLQRHCTLKEAFECFRQWQAKALGISASAWIPESDTQEGMLYLRVSGAQPAVEQACGVLGGERVEEQTAKNLWLSLREHTHPFFGDTVWRVSVPPLADTVNESVPLLEWGGAQRWLRQVSDVTNIRHAAAQRGGHATLFRAGAGVSQPVDGVFQPVSTGIAAITRRLKSNLDPLGTFYSGRLLRNI